MILVSPTAFKGTLSPFEAAHAMKQAVEKAFPSHSIQMLPVADGGDGTLDVLRHSLRGRIKHTRVQGPLGKPVRARWGFIENVRGFKGPVAVLEMAEASGLKLVRGRNRILDATTMGTGELMRAALNSGCRSLIVGVGGTATADGGAGALQALGLRYLDRTGCVISARPRDLSRLARVDRSGLDPRLRRVKIYVLCDVTNSLLGRNGSARTFGPQKGATPTQVRVLERVMRIWSRHAIFDVKRKPGAGAAGALAFGLAGFLGARLVEGGPFILKALNWTRHARKSSLIVTGEGRLDRTSFTGKAVGEVCRHRGRVRVGVVCGTSSLSSRMLRKKGVWNLVEMGPGGIKNPKEKILMATARLLRMYKGF